MKAALWDMDGTMLDTERYWFASEIDIMREAGLTWSMADAIGQVGQPIPATAAAMNSRGLRGGIEEITAELVLRVEARMREHLPWQPGVLDLLSALKQRGVSLALVTMAARPLADATLAAIDGVFDAVVTADDVSQGKPSPEAYLRAMQQLDIGAASCIAFEDSVPGMVSAWKSGAVTVAVQRYSDLSSVERDWTIDSFEGVTVEELEDIQCAGAARRRALDPRSFTG